MNQNETVEDITICCDDKKCFYNDRIGGCVRKEIIINNHVCISRESYVDRQKG